MGGKTGKLRIECEFLGVVNGAPVTITGRAHVGEGEDPGRRRLDLELHADVVPLGFDPALLALGGLDAVLLVMARPGEPPFPEDPLHVHLSWKLLDENCRDMGGFELAGTVRGDAGRLLDQGQFVEARTRMEPVERLASVGDGDGYQGSIVPLGTDGLVLTTASSFQTDFGNSYLAVAASRVVGLGEGWELARGLDVREVVVKRAGGRERDCRVLVGVGC